jgi:chitodextrinase
MVYTDPIRINNTITHIMVKKLVFLFAFALMLFITHSAHAALPANEQWRLNLLNDRVGYGRNADGGAQGTMCYVTTLADSGTGSLRSCAESTNSYWIAFNVSGTIALDTTIRIKSNKTIDGRGANITITNSASFYGIQGSWGDGIDNTLFQIGHYNDGLTGPVSNIIVENLKFIVCNRGCNAQIDIGEEAYDIWIDHNTFQSPDDEALFIGANNPPGFTLANPRNVTVSWNYFPHSTIGYDHGILTTDSLNNAASRTITTHHNRFSNWVRSPYADGGTIHSFNDYWDDAGYGAQIRGNAQFYVDNPILYRTVPDSYPMITGNVDPGCQGPPYCNNVPAANVKVVNPYAINATYEQVNPTSIFTPSSYYSYTPEVANETLRTKIMTQSGWQSVTPPTSDTQQPSTPQNLVATAVSSSQINLSWTASTDNVGVTGYKVFRGGTQVGTPSGTTYSDSTGLTPSTLYTYTVAAVDAAGNNSLQSGSASATTQAGPTPTPTPAPGLVAHYKLDETMGTTAADSAGSNTGTLVNGPTWTAGKMNNGLLFNGTTNYVNMGDVLDFERTNPFSIAAWVKTTSGSPGTAMVVAGKTETGTNLPGYMLSVRGDTAGDPYEFELRGNSGYPSTITVQFPRPADTNWQHVAVTYNGSSSASGVSVYVNGTPVTPTILGDALTATMVTAGPFELGARNGALTPLEGTLDDVRIYNRALSAAEVNQLYTGAVPTPTPTPTPTPDAQAPTTPTNTAGTPVSTSQINLTWTASTDNVGVSGYKVYRNGVQVGTPSGTTYSDTGLTRNTMYTYTVSAVDAANNQSAQSAPISVKTRKFTSGETVQVAQAPLNVRSCGGTSCSVTGKQNTATRTGTIIGGPTDANNYTWWNINYSSGTDGWSADTYLELSTAALPALGMNENEKMTQLASIATQLQTVQSTLDAYKANPNSPNSSSTLAFIAETLSTLQNLIGQIGGR